MEGAPQGLHPKKCRPAALRFTAPTASCDARVRSDRKWLNCAALGCAAEWAVWAPESKKGQPRGWPLQTP
jgi:hypothetical protein